MNKALNRSGISPLIDEHQIAPGDKLPERIQQLIANADSVILILSPAFDRSHYCRLEQDYAVSLGKRLLTVWRGGSELQIPKGLREFTHVDMRRPRSFDRGVTKLVAAIKSDVRVLRERARLQGRAAQWEHRGRPADELLRRTELEHIQALGGPALGELPRLVADFVEFSKGQVEHLRQIEYETLLAGMASKLSRGEIPDVIDLLLALHDPGFSPTDNWSEWERVAYGLLRRISTKPIESVKCTAGVPSSLDVSEEDWFLAVGTQEGAALAQVLRLPFNRYSHEPLDPDYWERYESHALKLGLSGEPRSLLVPTARAHPCSVLFWPGGVLNMPLVLKRGAVGGATLRMSIDSFGGVDREDYCNLFDVQDYGCLVTLASDESLSIHGGSSSGAGANSRLGWTCGDDRLFTLAIIGRQNVIRGPDERSVACLSERGELLILSLGGEVLTRIHLNLGNAPTRLQALQRYGRSCMVETSQEVLLVQQSGLDDAAVLRIRGLSGRSIRSTAYLPQGDGRIVIGYDDGSIEIHLVDTGGRTGVAHLRVHRSAVAALTLSRDANALASLADDGSIAVWRYPFSSPYAWIASQSSQATALCFAEGSRYVLSGHKDREIRLWELPAEDLSGHDDMVSLACETYPPSRGLFAIHRRSLWFSDFHHYYMVSRTGGMEQTARRQQDLHFIEAHACWSGPDGPLLLFPDFDKDEPEKAQSIRLVHWQVEGHVSAVDLTLHASRPTAWASHPDGQKFAIGYADGCLVEISAESGASINLTETADALKGVVSSRRGPRRVIWCRYGFEGRWLIAQYASRPHLVVIDRRSGVAFVLDQAGQHLDDVITGPVVLCGGDGGLIAMTAGSSAVHIAFDPEPQVTARRYEAVLRRVRSPDMPWTGVAVSPVGGWLVATRANLLVIWQLGAPSQARVVQTTERIVQMRFLPSSDRFVTVTADGNCQLWSAVSGQAIASLMRGAFRVEYLAQDASSLVVRLKNRYGALIELPTFRSTDSVRAKLIASRTSPGSW